MSNFREAESPNKARKPNERPSSPNCKLCFTEEKMNNLNVQFYPPPGNYLISANFEGLLGLLEHDFFICRSQGIPNGETYIAVSEAELDQMWQTMQTVEDGWDRRVQQTVWDAHFLTTATGQAGQEYLAGIIFPVWVDDDGDMIYEWQFHIGLEWRDKALPIAAKELIVLVVNETGGRTRRVSVVEEEKWQE